MPRTKKIIFLKQKNTKQTIFIAYILENCRGFSMYLDSEGVLQQELGGAHQLRQRPQNVSGQVDGHDEQVVLDACPGIDFIILKIFSPRNIARILVFLLTLKKN
jgi:hypothetical protein